MDKGYAWGKIALIALAVLLIGGAGIGVGMRLAHPGQGAGPSVSGQLGFTPLVKQLPAGYTIDASSLDRQDGALAYVAKNTNGGQIVISEQPKPVDAKIKSFLDQNVQKSQTVSGSSYPATLGDAPMGGKLLSVVVGNTWLMLTTPNANAGNDLIYIAQHL